MRCEDCGALLTGEPIELEAIRHGLTICEEYICSMEAERDAYDRMRAEAGEPQCVGCGRTDGVRSVGEPECCVDCSH